MLYLPACCIGQPLPQWPHFPWSGMCNPFSSTNVEHQYLLSSVSKVHPLYTTLLNLKGKTHFWFGDPPPIVMQSETGPKKEIILIFTFSLASYWFWAKTFNTSYKLKCRLSTKMPFSPFICLKKAKSGKVLWCIKSVTHLFFSQQMIKNKMAFFNIISNYK